MLQQQIVPDKSMSYNDSKKYIKQVLPNIPRDWIDLTTHRLDIYNEQFAKSQFLEQLELLYEEQNTSESALAQLPTAYDYIRLGHPLSCLLEWGFAKKIDIPASHVISFSSKTIPVLAVLRKNLLEKRATRICYTGELPEFLKSETIKSVYGYNYELFQTDSTNTLERFNGDTIWINYHTVVHATPMSQNVDFVLNCYDSLGCVLILRTGLDYSYVNDIQHVRRRETIAMTPAHTMTALQSFVNDVSITIKPTHHNLHKQKVEQEIQKVTLSPLKPLVGSSGLSIQYAIMMGLVDHAIEHHPGKAIKFIVPPNCYGGTNDQARRVAVCLKNVEVVDLPVDGDNDMVQSINTVLDRLAIEDAVPYIIAEIPTNPRVEVPDLDALKKALITSRLTPDGSRAIAPVFILDQTFCPNVHFLSDQGILGDVQTISYASGSKFPSGGRCTAGYCVGNQQTAVLMDKIEKHLVGCDNEATGLQYEILAQQLPSMNARIAAAYKNTRDFVAYIEEQLPSAKINFVSQDLAQQGFTPSVFSLDLPTRGNTAEQKESYKRSLNLKLINLMINEIPDESKFCVSYGQLKGCYWTIPATSTQGTTKEGDKDYIVRASLSPDLDLDRHKKVFRQFVDQFA